MRYARKMLSKTREIKPNLYQLLGHRLEEIVQRCSSLFEGNALGPTSRHMGKMGRLNALALRIGGVQKWACY